MLQLFCTGQVAVRIEGTTNAEGDVVEEGSGSLVKNRVRCYFNQLRETLMVQEAAAITAVDTYVRERLCSIRQLQEDLVAWLSQVFYTLIEWPLRLQDARSRPIVVHYFMQ